MSHKQEPAYDYTSVTHLKLMKASRGKEDSVGCEVTDGKDTNALNELNSCGHVGGLIKFLNGTGDKVINKKGNQTKDGFGKTPSGVMSDRLSSSVRDSRQPSKIHVLGHRRERNESSNNANATKYINVTNDDNHDNNSKSSNDNNSTSLGEAGAKTQSKAGRGNDEESSSSGEEARFPSVSSAFPQPSERNGMDEATRSTLSEFRRSLRLSSSSPLYAVFHSRRENIDTSSNKNESIYEDKNNKEYNNNNNENKTNTATNSRSRSNRRILVGYSGDTLRKKTALSRTNANDVARVQRKRAEGEEEKEPKVVTAAVPVGSSSMCGEKRGALFFLPSFNDARVACCSLLGGGETENQTMEASDSSARSSQEDLHVELDDGTTCDHHVILKPGWGGQNKGELLSSTEAKDVGNTCSSASSLSPFALVGIGGSAREGTKEEEGEAEQSTTGESGGDDGVLPELTNFAPHAPPRHSLMRLDIGQLRAVMLPALPMPFSVSVATVSDSSSSYYPSNYYTNNKRSNNNFTSIVYCGERDRQQNRHHQNQHYHHHQNVFCGHPLAPSKDSSFAYHDGDAENEFNHQQSNSNTGTCSSDGRSPLHTCTRPKGSQRRKSYQTLFHHYRPSFSSPHPSNRRPHLRKGCCVGEGGNGALSVESTSNLIRFSDTFTSSESTEVLVEGSPHKPSSSDRKESSGAHTCEVGDSSDSLELSLGPFVLGRALSESD